MPEPLVFKRSLFVALLAALRAITPAVVAIGMLYVIAQMFGVRFGKHFLMLAVLLGILSPISLKLPEIASQQVGSARWSAAANVVARWLLLLAILLAIGYVTKFSEEFSRRVLLTWAVVTPIPLVFAMLAVDEALRRLMLSSSNVRRAIFAGYSEASRALAERLRRHPELCMAVDGYFDDRSADRLSMQAGAQLLGRLNESADYVKRHGTEVIFIALPMRHVQRVLDLLDDLRDTTASIYYVPDVFVFDLIQSRTSEILGVPVVAMCETPFFGHRGVVKRVMDVVLSSIAIVMLLPLLIAIGLMVKSSSSGPVIFRQRRYGLDGREIFIYKFRTMTVTEDGDRIQQATRNDQRITSVGRVLRRFSLDELPQLINVLKGNMSLVGPRPHAVAHNEEYRKLIKGYMVRHKVLPGITGLAQVNGCRGETAHLDDMRARIEYDLDYLRHWSPALDFKIMLRTVLLLFTDRKAY